MPRYSPSAHLIVLVSLLATVLTQPCCAASSDETGPDVQPRDQAIEASLDMNNQSCSKLAKHKAIYLNKATGITLSWDAHAKYFKVELHGARPSTTFRMPAQNIGNMSMAAPEVYYVSNPVQVRNQAMCKGSLGMGTILVQPQPGTADSNEYSVRQGRVAGMIEFKAYKMLASICGDNVTIWGWATSISAERTSKSIANLNTLYRANPVVFSLPTGMEVTALIQGNLITSNATSNPNLLSFPSTCYPAIPNPARKVTRSSSDALLPSARSATRSLLASATPATCKAAYGGGASGMAESTVGFVVSVAEIIPGVGEATAFIQALNTWLVPAPNTPSAYECIAAFVEEAVFVGISEYEKGYVESQVDDIISRYDKFNAAYKLYSAKGTPNAAEQAALSTAFDNIIQGTDTLASYLTGTHQTDPEGLLTTFVTFATAQYFTLYHIKYSSYSQIYGYPASQTATILSGIVTSLKTTVIAFQTYYKATAAAVVSTRSKKVSKPSVTSTVNTSPYGTTVDWSADFTDSAYPDTLYYFRGGDGEQATLTTASDSLYKLVVNRVESAERINVYQATSSAPLWPLMVPGNTKAAKYTVTVEENMCFDDWPACNTDGGNLVLPSSHDYQTYNISRIDIANGAWIDYIKITYTSSKGTYTQEMGNKNGGGTFALTGLPTNPIVAVTWHSGTSGTKYVSNLQAAVFTRADGTVTTAGKTGGHTYTDDFSLWKGKVWLCGAKIHGTSSRVNGFGPSWCYWKADVL